MFQINQKNISTITTFIQKKKSNRKVKEYIFKIKHCQINVKST